MGKGTPEPPIIEIDDEHISPPAHRTRLSARSAQETAGDKLVKTSDYSSEESPDRMRKEMAQVSFLLVMYVKNIHPHTARHTH